MCFKNNFCAREHLPFLFWYKTVNKKLICKNKKRRGARMTFSYVVIFCAGTMACHIYVQDNFDIKCILLLKVFTPAH